VTVVTEGKDKPMAPAEGADLELQRRVAAVLLEVSQMIGSDLALGTVLRSAMDAVAAAMNAEACSILLRSRGSDELCFHIVKGDHTGSLPGARIPIDDHSIAGWVAGHDQVLSVPDAYADARFNPEYDRETGFRTRSVLCAPLHVKDKQVGVIEMFNRRDGREFDAWDCELIKAVASLVAVAIDSAAEHEALLKAERLAAVGQAIAGMAHYTRNILNNLQFAASIVDENLTAQAGDEDPARRAWAVISRNIGLLSDVVLDMLSYSKTREPVRTPCSLDELIGDVVSLLRPRAERSGVTVGAAAEGTVGPVSIDREGIRRCLINLVGNAIEACGPGGRVTVSTAPGAATGTFLLEVRDTGCGVPPELQARIFEPMFSTKGSKGTGLGLAVSKKIVDEHGGTIRLHSEPGRGTTFTLELPAGAA
jgi:signal transduction histidine kinase